MSKKEKKNYILANIDKYIVDGRGNFYWEDAEEGMEYIYENELEVLDIVEVMLDIGKRIYETKEDWGLDFLEDDIDVHRPLLLYKNKKDGRIMNAQRVWCSDSEGFSVGKSINDYKGTDIEKLGILEVNGIINEEQQKILDKWHQETEHNIRKSAELLEKCREEDRKFQEERKKQQALWEKQQVESKNTQPTPNFFSEKKNNSETPYIENNSTNIAENLYQTEQQITQLLINKQVKTTDLPKEYHNWIEQLKNLTTKESITAYAQELTQVLAQFPSQQYQPTKPSNALSSSAKIAIGIGISLTVIGVIFLVLKRRIKKKY